MKKRPKGRFSIGFRKIQSCPEMMPGHSDLDILVLGRQEALEACQAPPVCQSISSFSDFVLNKESSSIDFLSQKSALPERDCADQPASEFPAAGGFHFSV